MNDGRIRVLLFIFLAGLIFYVVRGTIIVSHFQKIPISPSTVILPAPYGDIIGAGDCPILQNTLSYDVYVDVSHAKALSQLEGWSYPGRVIDVLNYFGINTDSKTVSNIINSGKGGIEVGLVNENKIYSLPSDWVDFLNIQRVYVQSKVATSLNVVAKAIQGEYENYIKPKKNGEILYDAFGPYAITSGIKEFVKPVGGDEIVTTINPSIQAYAQSAIEKAVLTNAASGGEVIITDPKNGDIIAMATTWPWDAPVMDVFEPGSSIKPLIFSAALQEGIVDTNTTFTGPYYIPDPNIPLVIKDAEVHPWPIDLREALVYSSDIAEMKIAKKFIDTVGDQNYYNWFLKFGLGKKTGVDLPSEVDGFLTPPSQWYGIGGQEMAIGQSIAVTGVQLISSLNSVVNGGYLIKPHILKEIVSPSGSIVSVYTPQSTEIFNSAVTQIVRSFMIDVVEKGTGMPAKLPGVLVGGKTGTAEKSSGGKVSTKGPYFSIFYGFFPADDPVYSILVMVDSPSKGLYYGEDVSAPVFHDIGEYILNSGYLQTDQSHVFSSFAMPNLKGLTLNESLYILNELSISATRISFNGDGVVLEQSPAPNTPISTVKNVKLVLGSPF
uniref:PASTA domain-containing protein n=1 Tax=Mesoaciditoga lauensis TaxID=1495039 RepID=A0A7V3VT02_9BACT